MYNDTVTVFNRKGDFWWPTVLEGVHLIAADASLAGRFGRQSGVKAALMVPYEAGCTWGPHTNPAVAVRVGRGGAAERTSSGGNAGARDVELVTTKQYVPPKVWREVETPEEFITFQAGDGFDFFLEGAWEQSGPMEDDGLYDRLRRTRDGVYAIGEVTRYRALPHFEIIGR